MSHPMGNISHADTRHAPFSKNADSRYFSRESLSESLSELDEELELDESRRLFLLFFDFLSRRSFLSFDFFSFFSFFGLDFLSFFSFFSFFARLLGRLASARSASALRTSSSRRFLQHLLVLPLARAQSVPARFARFSAPFIA